MLAKSVTRPAQISVKHDVYKRALLSGHHVTSNNIRIGSLKYLLQTIRKNKIFLSAFDDKRFFQNEGIRCLPFGHYEIRHWQVHRDILGNDYWVDEEGEETPESSPIWSTIIRDFTFPLLATFRRFQTKMLTVKDATMKLKLNSQTRYLPSVTLTCIEEITRKVN